MDRTEVPGRSSEARFWDNEIAKESARYWFHFYTAINESLWQLVLQELGVLNSRRVLFVGCGTTSTFAKEMARRGAEVWCVDISHGSLVKLLSHPFGTSRRAIYAVAADAEQMPFADAFFDAVVGKAIVHHLDIMKFMNEVQRVSVSNGLIVFSEPLGVNPLINLYRRLTPGARVPTEHPLRPADVEFVRSRCDSMRAHHNFLFAIGALPWFALGLNRLGRLVFRIGSWLDRGCFAVCPPAKWLAWNVTLAGRLHTRSKGHSA